MRLLAALTVGVFCAALAGAITGALPSGPVWRSRPRRETDGRAWLQQAGLGLGPAQFWIGSVLLALVAFVVLLAVTGAALVALVPAVAVAALPRAYYARRRATQLRAVQEAWPDALRDLLASITAGRSLTQAVGDLAVTGPTPLREAFASFPQYARMVGTTAALEREREDLADPTSDRVIEVLILAHERGGPTVRAILEDLVVAIVKDVKLADEIETEGLEMRINARAVVVLPWLVLVFLTARDGAFRDFYQGRGGVATLAIGALLTLVGVAVLGRLGHRPEEVRVLGAAARSDA